MGGGIVRLQDLQNTKFKIKVVCPEDSQSKYFSSCKGGAGWGCFWWNPRWQHPWNAGLVCTMELLHQHLHSSASPLKLLRPRPTLQWFKGHQWFYSLSVFCCVKQMLHEVFKCLSVTWVRSAWQRGERFLPDELWAGHITSSMNSAGS